LKEVESLGAGTHGNNLGGILMSMMSTINNSTDVSQSQVGVHQLQPYVEALKRASSLNENEAKLCVYYAILTYKIEEVRLFPVLTLRGDPSTGKSSLMKVMAQLVNKPVPNPMGFLNLDGWQGLKLNDTFPSLRDGLKENTTAFIEEGDASYKKNESLIADRYSRQTAIVRYKKEEAIGHSQAGADIFGASIIHKRRGYKDPATTTRSIFILTNLECDRIHSTTVFTNEEKEDFANMARAINLLTLDGNTRAHDLWYPLVGLAMNTRDYAWGSWAVGEVEKQTRLQDSGGNFDPQKAIILGVLAEAVKEDDNGNLTFSEGKYGLEPIKHTADIYIQLSINEIQTTLQLRGFEVKTRRGTPRVLVTADKLRRVCGELHIEDEAVSAIPAGG
jgi:hypothetical protein